MEHCEKCLGYITDRISFPLHTHEPIRQYIRHKNIKNHAWKIASFYSWAFQKNGEFTVQKVLEQSKIIVTMKHSKEILERKICGNDYLLEHPEFVWLSFFYEYERLFPEFGKEFEVLVEFLFEWSILSYREEAHIQKSILWFIEWFYNFMILLPDIHREHSGGYVVDRAAKKATKVVNPFSAPIPIRPQSATRVRIHLPRMTTHFEGRLPVSTIVNDTLSIKIPKYADDYVENWDDFIEQLYL